MKYYLVLMSFLLAFPGCTSAPVVTRSSELTFTYTKLKFLDIDEMNDLLQRRIAAFRKDQDKTQIVEALMISLARPNDDNLLEKNMNTIRYSLETNDQWEDSVRVVVKRSIGHLKDPTTAPEDQMTYLVVLSNLLLEFKPEFSKPDVSPDFEKKMVEVIAGADLVVSDEVKKETSLNSMGSVPSPSEIARNMLEEINRKSNPRP